MKYLRNLSYLYLHQYYQLKFLYLLKGLTCPLELYCHYHGHSSSLSAPGGKQLLSLSLSLWNACDPSVSKLTVSLLFHIIASISVW